MRTSIFILISACLAISLPAQQPATVTPQTLPGWTVVSANALVLGKQAELTLPAGAQIVRSFTVSDFGLQFTTQPFIGTSETDWPVLELGSAALVFGRNGPTGKLLLVVGNGSPLDLPFDFKLGADDRSIEALTINFSRQGSTVRVEVGGQARQFSVSPEAGESAEIVASAGAAHDWTFQRLVVLTAKAGNLTALDAGLTAGSSVDNGSPRNQQPSAGTSPGSGAGDLVGPPKPVGVKSAKVQTTATGPQYTLEIFTPPAIRRARVDAVRAVTLTTKK